MVGSPHLQAWTRKINLGLIPICVGSIVSSLMADTAHRYGVALGGLLCGYAFLLVLIFVDAPVVGDVRMRLKNWRQNNYLANDIAKTVLPLRELAKGTWPSVASWTLLGVIALSGVKG